MAWDPLGTNPESGVEEYSGDTPFDALGDALRQIGDECTARIDRLPTLAELVEGLAAALDAAPAGEVLDPARTAARLARLRAAAAVARPAPKRQRPRQGDVLAIPYAGGGLTEIYGWILFVPGANLPSPGLGVCVVILDRDVRPGDDLAEVVRAPLLLGPLHPNDREIREGSWRIVGRVAGDFDALLPRFAVQVRRADAWVGIVRDYAGAEVPDTAENRARVRKQSVGGAGHLPLAIRALRGQGRWLEGFADWLATGVLRP